jgi:hypothetical protein
MPQELGPTSWDVVLGVASFVLLAGGVTAVVRRRMDPGQAVAILAVAVGVGAVAAFATRFPSGFYATAVVATVTLAGIVMAVAVVGRR